MKKILLALFFVFLFSITGLKASAATIQTTPSTGSYKVGDTFKVDVTVSSPDKAINAVSGILSFPKDKLQFISISKTSSILSIWAQEPSYYDSGENGNISFEGVIPNPGFTGTRGKILSVTFKVKATWQAELSFSSASVLANDGLGTNVLTNSLPGIFTLNSSVTPYVAPTEPKPTVQTASNVPSEAQITSTTHPDSEKWYNDNNPSFKWTLQKNITGVRIYGDQNPDTELPKTSQGLSSSHTYKNVADGTWYLHIRLRNSAGWNDTTHFKFNIDTVPPKPFSIEFPDGKETSNPKPRLSFDAIDETSGIDHYEIAINNIIVNASLEIGKNNVYVLSNQNPGEKEVSVKAFDKAGNFYEATDKFTVLAEPCPQQTKETENKINYLLIVELLIALNLILITLVVYLIYTRLHKVNVEN
ncbi:MAG: cohesin domain-containing protein [Candidatus Paceibacterota bacterium]|jgi:hypothetical protein